MSLPNAIFSWSGGKDSAYGLHQVLAQELFHVKYLLTTVNKNFNRISMHGVREELLDLQAASVGIPLIKVMMDEGTNTEYEHEMEKALSPLKKEGIQHVIYGDIFLQDLRTYREQNLSRIGMAGVFPLWKLDTNWMMRDFLKRGFKTVTCCIDESYLSEEWVGKEVDESFIENLPHTVDPCGENGEFHTFCYEGPVFKKKILFSRGERAYKDLPLSPSSPLTKRFWFCDLIPAQEETGFRPA
jgi:uncharacterized protein (TIGR00290 family)